MSEPTSSAVAHADLAADFQAAGFTPGMPPYLDPGGTRIDANVCSRARCEACNRRGLAYHSYRSGTRYRAIAVCRSCGHSIEF